MPKIILIVIVFITIYFIYQVIYLPKIQSLNVDIKGQAFSLEIARTLSQITRGLCGRSSLCPNCGMIFVFKSPQILSFWMKNTLIPLDIIFLDSTGKIINFVTASPELNISDNKLKIYRSDSVASFALELPAGTVSKLNLLIGNTINLHGLNP